MLLFLPEFADSDKSIHVKQSDYDPGVYFFVVHAEKLGGTSGTETYNLENCCYPGLSDRCKKLHTWVYSIYSSAMSFDCLQFVELKVC